jgi:hypothetical protein
MLKQWNYSIHIILQILLSPGFREMPLPRVASLRCSPSSPEFV